MCLIFEVWIGYSDRPVEMMRFSRIIFGEITMDNRPIGVFDSGLGGLTVLKEIRNLLPTESIVYFGDSGEHLMEPSQKKPLSSIHFRTYGFF